MKRRLQRAAFFCISFVGTIGRRFDIHAAPLTTDNHVRPILSQSKPKGSESSQWPFRSTLAKMRQGTSAHYLRVLYLKWLGSRLYQATGYQLGLWGLVRRLIAVSVRCPSEDVLRSRDPGPRSPHSLMTSRTLAISSRRCGKSPEQICSSCHNSRGLDRARVPAYCTLSNHAKEPR
jgi:hypothetical protein